MRVYVHIPFCLHKCHYCDFNSHVFASPPWAEYTAALVAEIGYYAAQPQFAGRRVASLFFGGGTPSLAPPELFQQVLDALAQYFGFEQEAEISLEANPGASEAERFKAYYAAGINRVSIGVQSFRQEELKWLERIHSPQEALRAYEIARDAGFTNINLDLMYALPGQTLEEWFYSLQQAIELNPEHLSCYQLTVEPHTRLQVMHQQQALAFPDEELALDFFRKTREQLQHYGYSAYEISNFARDGLHCRHNCGYWQYDDYIGIGAGASGKWDTEEGGVFRYSNMRSPQSYMDRALHGGLAEQSHECLNLRESMGESVWLALRQKQGLDLQWFKQRFQCAIEDEYQLLLQQWLAQEMLEKKDGYLCLTEQGLNLADEVAASFL